MNFKNHFVSKCNQHTQASLKTVHKIVNMDVPSMETLSAQHVSASKGCKSRTMHSLTEHKLLVKVFLE